jgi:flavorubredoxin
MNTTLTENINWVGHVDWPVRDFHSFDTDRGATYNAYLIRDEKTTLIDTVKWGFEADLKSKIEALTDPEKVAYVVCNHAEPDHSGSLPGILKFLPNATLLCDEKCKKILSRHYDISDWKIQLVSTGDEVSIGQRTLHFIETPMVHWPESMFTYVPEDKILFSMDAFGQHYATSQRFDDEVPLFEVIKEAKTYYANIIMPYGKMVAKTLDKVADLDIEMIAPSHGLIWRTHLDKIVRAYKDWMVCQPSRKVLVMYDTMWEGVGKMAEAIHGGAAQEGIDAQLIHIRRTNLTNIATEVMDAAAVAFGSSTLNQHLMPMAGAVLTYLKGLRPVNKAGFAFGSYGWSGGGAEDVDSYLKEMKWDILRDPITSRYRPTNELLEECRQAGMMLADKAREVAGDRQPSDLMYACS